MSRFKKLTSKLMQIISGLLLAAILLASFNSLAFYRSTTSPAPTSTPAVMAVSSCQQQKTAPTQVSRCQIKTFSISSILPSRIMQLLSVELLKTFFLFIVALFTSGPLSRIYKPPRLIFSY